MTVEDRQLEVAKQIVAVQRLYANSFLWKNEQRPSRAAHKCMCECERAFGDKLYDLA